MFDGAAIDIVLGSIAARNSGDVDAWMGTLGGEELAGVTEYRNLAEANVVASYEMTVTEPDGPGSGCAVVGTGLDGETLVSCPVRVDDDFIGAAGVFYQGQSIFYVLDGKVVQWDDGLNSNDPGDLETEFLRWFFGEHSEVASEMTAGLTDWYTRTPDDMATVLQYVDEFVAQSDVYPVGG